MSDQAGRLADWDELASKFFVATGAARDSVYNQAAALAKTAGEGSKHYLKVMEKVKNGTEEYVAKESAR